MANTALCNDTSEAVELCESQGLYLKPVAKINICAQLPQLKTPGKTISNWEVMEKVKNMIRPETFLSIKVVKSTMEFIRLEGEIENKSKLALLIIKLDGKTIKLSGFPESLKVRAAETKVTFPIRHDWDAHFRDAKNINEMRPGERADTIYLQDLPTRWFSNRCDKDGQKNESKLRPSKEILQKVFETFGEVRFVDIPMLDPYRKEIMGMLAKPGMIQTFNYGQDIQFDAYVQFKDYISFMKAMDALRGMKLMYKEDEEKAYTANIKVDFDRTRHLSDKMIRKRHSEREKLQALEAQRQEQERLEREEGERRKEEERLRKLAADKEKQRKKEEKQRLKQERRKQREERRRQKQMVKKQREEEQKMRKKIALEERRLLIAQRKLESLRLLSELFDTVKDDKVKEELVKREAELEEQRRQELLAEQKLRLEEEQKKAEAKIQKKLKLQQQEQELREKILKNFLAKEQRDKERQREELRHKLSGTRRLKSAVIMKTCLSSIGHDDNSNDEDTPTTTADKDQPSSLSSTAAEDKKEKKEIHGDDDDDDVEILESVQEKEKTVIEILSSDDDEGGGGGDIDGPSPPKLKPSSTLEKVLQSNRLRAWGSPSNSPRKKPRSRPRPPQRTMKRSKLLNIKRGVEREKKKKKKDVDSEDSDSGDSTIMVIPPPRSSFAPPDDPINFMPPPRLMPPPSSWWGPCLSPHRAMLPPCAGPPPPEFRSPLRGRSHQPERNPRRVSGRNFHTFKEPYLRKYNNSHHSSRPGDHDSSGSARGRGDGSRASRGDRSGSPFSSSPKSVASSVSYSLSKKLSKKRDSEGRYMYPLS